MALQIKAISGMEKCFHDEDFYAKTAITGGSALRGETYWFQVACALSSPSNRVGVTVCAKTALTDDVTVREIVPVPVRFPAYTHSDDDFLRKSMGLYPDVLQPLPENGAAYLIGGELKSFLITVDVPETAAAGDFPITVTMRLGEEVKEVTVTLHVVNAVLPKQEMMVTEWFHTDCLAQYYHVDVFSEEHWTVIEHFMRAAVRGGDNMILTPVFTPPLDTAVGGERLTTQLVDVTRTAEGWQFGFEKLERWVKTAQRAGMEYFEISHLYTQWGAGHAPKIMGWENGEYRKLFGWETDSLSDEYRTFLRAFLTALLPQLDQWGIRQKTVFHVSDEPSLDHLEQYKAAREQIADLLEGHIIMDALSNFAFYKTGAVSTPIPANNHLDPFLEAGVPNLWTYYCCSQTVKVSNRMIAMPSYRTRVMGVQMWKYNIVGFLHWGFNFYNSQNSIRTINPYLITDGDYFVPAGDPYAVYPGEGGEALDSLHRLPFTMALQDVRAMKLAETLAGRDAVLRILDGEGNVTFSEYPRSGAWLQGVRDRVNGLIEENVR